jgi:hypothetical protein
LCVRLLQLVQRQADLMEVMHHPALMVPRRAGRRVAPLRAAALVVELLLQEATLLLESGDLGVQLARVVDGALEDANLGGFGLLAGGREEVVELG